MIYNLFIGVCLVFLATGTSYSQSIQYGVTGGVNLSTLRLTELPHTNDLGTYKPGFLLGGHLEKNLTGNLSLFTQGLITYKRTSRTRLYLDIQVDDEIFDFYIIDEISAITIDVPVLLKYQIPLKLKFPIHLLSGTYLNYAANVRRSLIFKDANSDLEDGDGYNATFDVTGPFDIGGIGGIGVTIAEKFLLAARYNHGLTNYYSNPSYFKGGTIKSRFFSFQLIYYL